MYIKEYLDSKNAGVRNLENRVTPERVDAFEKRNQMLEAGTGIRSGCLRTLSSDCEVRAMLAYFLKGDMVALKRWAYTSSKASIMLQHETNEVIGIEHLLWPLISDNEEVIDWYCANPMFYESLDDPKRKERINSHEFARLQVQRAMTHQWDALAADCERALAESEVFSEGVLNFV